MSFTLLHLGLPISALLGTLKRHTLAIWAPSISPVASAAVGRRSAQTVPEVVVAQRLLSCTLMARSWLKNETLKPLSRNMARESGGFNG